MKKATNAKGADQSRFRPTWPTERHLRSAKTARRQVARPQWHPCGSPAPPCIPPLRQTCPH